MSKDETTDAPPVPIYKMPDTPNQPIYQPRMVAPPPDAPRAPGAVTPDAVPARELLEGMQQPPRPEVPKGTPTLAQFEEFRAELLSMLKDVGTGMKDVVERVDAKANKRIDDLQGIVAGAARDEQPSLERLSACESRLSELAQVVADLKEELGDGGEDDGS